MNEFFIGIISSIAGALLVIIVQWVYRCVVEQKAPFTGTWYDSIYDDEGQIVKTDTFQIRQRGDNLTGKITRTSPNEQKHRNWHFTGKLRGRQFFAIFWSTSEDILSYGCWYLRQTGDDTFKGYYLSLQRTVAEDGSSIEEVKPVRLELKRSRG